MYKSLLLLIFILHPALNKPDGLPIWFNKAFQEQTLSQKYAIIKTNSSYFLEADFNGDKKVDIAVQIQDKITGKTGIILMNYGQKNGFIFGAGKKFDDQRFDNTRAFNGWRVYKDKYVFKTIFKPNGDILGGKKIKLSHPAVYIYNVEDGDEIAGELIYWDGAKYIIIHQGE